MRTLLFEGLWHAASKMQSWEAGYVSSFYEQFFDRLAPKMELQCCVGSLCTSCSGLHVQIQFAAKLISLSIVNGDPAM